MKSLLEFLKPKRVIIKDITESKDYECSFFQLIDGSFIAIPLDNCEFASFTFDDFEIEFVQCYKNIIPVIGIHFD
jgi:hypothetical protein